MAIKYSRPNLGMILPDSTSVPIHQREIIHPAIDHLKNNEKEDILDSMSNCKNREYDTHHLLRLIIVIS
jgi:hypothetical protein